MAGPRTVRLFVSSPGDVEPERQRTEVVAERLNGIYPDSVRFEVIRWENKFYTADRSFQPQISEASECEIVIGIFWTRLGSELPPDFVKMPDGSPYPSGTAYEVLSAIERKKRGLAQGWPLKTKSTRTFTFSKNWRRRFLHRKTKGTWRFSTRSGGYSGHSSIVGFARMKAIFWRRSTTFRRPINSRSKLKNYYVNGWPSMCSDRRRRLGQLQHLDHPIADSMPLI